MVLQESSAQMYNVCIGREEAMNMGGLWRVVMSMKSGYVVKCSCPVPTDPNIDSYHRIVDRSSHDYSTAFRKTL